MADILLYIPLDDYLAQWFINHHGGTLPVKLRKGCAEADILEVFLTKRPLNEPPATAVEGTVAVCIPAFRYKPAEYYNYLPAAAVDAFIHTVRTQFDYELWADLFRFGNIGKRKDHLIYAWMEAHGIACSDKNWNAVAKRYQRKRKWTLENRRKNKKNL